MKSLIRCAHVTTPGADACEDKVIQHSESGTGRESGSVADVAPATAFPATFAFQLSRQAGFFPKSSFRSL